MSVLLVDRTPLELRIGLLEEDRVVRLHHEYPQRVEPRLGALYQGRVHSKDNRLGGVFVDLGSAQGFLPAEGRAMPPLGASLTVGIRREAIGDKAAQLVANPALRLPLATVRRRDGELACAPGPIGAPEDGEEDALRLAGEAFAEGEAGPRSVPAPLIRAVTGLLTREIEEIHVTDADAAAALREALGPEADRVALAEPAALRAVLDEAEEEALWRIVPLPGGGRLVFDEAEALTAIDVDLGRQEGRSAKGAAERAFAALLPVLGRQGALRSLGGQIVIDLPRRAAPSPKILRDRLTKALSPLGRVSIPAVTGEGICVVIAPRPVPGLLERLTEPGEGSVLPGRRLRADVLAARSYRLLEARLLADRSGSCTLSCPERALPHLEGEAAEALRARYGARFTLSATSSEEPHVR
ncbi:ribonuclease E/G [Parvularcula oceani]|uniref:ribonuclease E/G n=1 Tax=Parvularcula oceani TaxID=1247963 RepID=UPI0004E13017|nr:ribonuclease E/G [Parvularcula oceani]